MRLLLIGTVLLFTSVAAYAAMPCGDLKADIAQKLDAKGIQFYSLELVPTEKVKDPGKVIGTCDGGKKKILYSRTPATTKRTAATNASVKSKP
jgi:uncharacterized protein DUF1161